MEEEGKTLGTAELKTTLITSVLVHFAFQELLLRSSGRQGNGQRGIFIAINNFHILYLLILCLFFVQKLRNKLKMASHYPLWEIHSATNRPPDLYNLWPKIVIGKISLSSAKS